MKVLHKTLKKLTIGEAQTHLDLTVLPLYGGRSERAADYLTLADAVGSGLASVREVSEGGSVPDLLFDNRADLPVLVIDGEELVGAKQNRTVNLTVLVPAKSEISIPVSCVEAGRWNYRTREFEVSDRAHFSRGRAAKVASVSGSLRHRGSRRSDQGRVWNDIAYAAQNLSAQSPTQAMGAIFDRHRHTLEDYVAAFEPKDGQIGAVFAVGREISGFDLFAHASTLRVMLPKLVRSYGVEALDRHRDGGRCRVTERAVGFLRRVTDARSESYPAVGLGTDIRITGDGVVGGGLMHDDRLLHLAAFRLVGEGERTAREPGFATVRNRRRSISDR